MSIKFSLSTKKNVEQSEILVTLHTKTISRQTGTGIMIDPRYWDKEKQCIAEPRFRLATAEQKKLCAELREKDKLLAGIRLKIEDAVNERKYTIGVNFSKTEFTGLIHGCSTPFV